MTEYGDQLRVFEQPPPKPRPAVIVALAGVVFAGVALLGLPLGWLWQQLAPDVPVRIIDDNGKLSGIVPDAQPEEFAAGDGWFVLLGFGFGILVAVAVWVLVRQVRGPVGLLALFLGALVAGVAAWWFGKNLGLAQYQAALDAAAAGTELSKPSGLRITVSDWWPSSWGEWRLQGVLLIPALAAVVTTTLMAGFSRWPTLRPETEPHPVSPWLHQPLD